MIDWNATAAWIALVVTLVISLLVPLVTAIINNKHQLEVKKIDMLQSAYNDYNLKMRTVFEDYINWTSKELTYRSDLVQTASYLKSYHELYFYVPKELWDKLEYMNHVIYTDNVHAKDEFLLLVRELADILEKQEKSSPQ
ncbi:hypothetical protein [Anaerocolumna chitinilytica]|uniref:DUF4363 family protein n=1 Tax=Anaerocolumna chitinilytica TaxID=1727145 RepID=A0A7M3SA23_9FIRM|nr:hypothetical protein [Anaerocolumna chitinilytica]BCK01441.1 hypothetical protein bsdcttw_44810 [Anaerocolumna chitinilytica]